MTRKIYFIGGRFHDEEEREIFWNKYGMLIKQVYDVEVQRDPGLRDFTFIPLYKCDREEFERIWTSADTCGIFWFSHGSPDGSPVAHHYKIDEAPWRELTTAEWESSLIKPALLNDSSPNLRFLVLMGCRMGQRAEEWRKKMPEGAQLHAFGSDMWMGDGTARSALDFWIKADSFWHKPETPTEGARFLFRYLAGSLELAGSAGESQQQRPPAGVQDEGRELLAGLSDWLRDHDQDRAMAETPQLIAELGEWLRQQERQEISAPREWNRSGSLSHEQDELLVGLGNWLSQENEKHQEWAAQVQDREQHWLEHERVQGQEWLTRLAQDDQEWLERQQDRFRDTAQADGNLLATLGDWLQKENQRQRDLIREQQEEQHEWVERQLETQNNNNLGEDWVQDWRQDFQEHYQDRVFSVSPQETLANLERWLEDRGALLAQERQQQFSQLETNLNEHQAQLHHFMQQQQDTLAGIREQQQQLIANGLSNFHAGQLDEGHLRATFSSHQADWQRDLQQGPQNWQQGFQQGPQNWQQGFQQGPQNWGGARRI